MGFEAAPFKLPLEYVDIMGGLDSSSWVYFKKLFKEGFEAARKHSDSLISEWAWPSRSQAAADAHGHKTRC
jgi:phosphatidylinositol 4-kinase